MASLGNLFFKIGADVSEATKGIKEVKGQLESIKKITGFTAIIQGANAAASVINSVVAAVRPLVDEFDKAAKGAAKLETALKGDAVGARQLIAQANQLAGTRLFPSDVTVNAQAMLATLGFTKNAIGQLTPVIQDFASATGIELQQAFQTVGKAIAFGGDGLKKYGVIVKDSSTPVQRFTDTMDQLKESFGGQAEAAAKVGAGPIQLLIQKFSLLKEIAGASLVAFANEFLPKVSEGVDLLGSSLQNLPIYAANVAKAIIAMINPFAKAYENILKLDSAIGSPLQKLQGQIQKLLSVDPNGTGGFDWKGFFEDIKNGIGSFREDITPATKEIVRYRDAFSGLSLSAERASNGLARSLFIQEKQNELLNENTALIQSINSGVDRRANQLANDLKKSLIDEKILTFQAKEELLKYAEAQKGASSVLFQAAAERAKALKALQDAQGGPSPVKGVESQEQDENDSLFLPGTFDKTKNLFKGLFASVKDEDITRLNDIFSTKGIQAYNTELDNLNTKINTTNSILGGIGSAATEAFSNMAASLLDGSLAFKDLGLAALDAARKIINAALAEAIAAAIAGSLKNAGNIIVGLALAAIAVSAVTALFRSKVPKLAKGGLAYGPQLAVIGDNPNASRDPEVISPLSKLRDMITGEMFKMTAMMANAMDAALSRASVEVPSVQPNAIQSAPQEIIIKGQIDGSVIRLAYDRSASTQSKFQPNYY